MVPFVAVDVVACLRVIFVQVASRLPLCDGIHRPKSAPGVCAPCRCRWHIAAQDLICVLVQLSDNFNYDEKGQGILESVGVHDGRVNLKTFLSWLDVIDDSQAYASELDAWVQFIIEAAGEERAAQFEHTAVATCSEHFANLERQMRALMDGATELQESLRAVSLDQSIVQTAIPAALMITAGKSHKWPETVAGLRNYEAELNRTMEA